jgi:mannose-6-phosphate isomerase
MPVTPLIFRPIFKPKPWGGRRLASILGKALPPDVPIGESWELADLEDDQSVVASGPFAGKTLGTLVRDWGCDLVGGAPLVDGRFPLLLKFLDARDTLSVQVHPDQAAAEARGGRVRVKHEAWYVFDAEPDAAIYRGLRPGIGIDDLRLAVDRGQVESVLNRIPVRAGDAYYLPSGTIHALGAGALVAEVQTPSDVTYRLFDWNRVDPAGGAPRALHVEEALACVSIEPPAPEIERRSHVASVWTAVTSLIRCPSFHIERVRMVDGVEQPIPHAEMVIWMVLEGRGEVRCGALKEPLGFARGDTVLLPAAMRDGVVRALENCMWLEVTVPIDSPLVGYERPERETPQSAAQAPGYVRLNVPRPEDES